MQKYFTPNPLDHKFIRNKGELPRYYVENNHDPIVSREVWQAVQDSEYSPNDLSRGVPRDICLPFIFAGYR